MQCIKTGFHAKLWCYNEYLYGDAYDLNGVWVFRVCQRSHTPIRSVYHFTISEPDMWFDERMTSPEWNSTLIAAARRVTYHDYDGIAV